MPQCARSTSALLSINTDMTRHSAALAALDSTLRRPNSPINCRASYAETAVTCWEWLVRCFKRRLCSCEYVLMDAKLRSNRVFLASQIHRHMAADCALLPTQTLMTGGWIVS